MNIIDATDPNHPTSIAKWTLGANPSGTGWLPKQFAHSLRSERRDVAVRLELGRRHGQPDIRTWTSPKIVHVIDIIPPTRTAITIRRRWRTTDGLHHRGLLRSRVPARAFAAGEVYVYDKRDETHQTARDLHGQQPPTRTDGISPITTPRSCTTISSSRRGTPMAWCEFHEQARRDISWGHPHLPAEGSPFIWGVYRTAQSLILASDPSRVWIARPGIDF